MSFEIYRLFLRLFTAFTPWRFRRQADLLVNIGAGPSGKAGWVNTDIFPRSGVNCLYDCSKKLPFADQTVKMIHCEHFLEHLDYTAEVPLFLSECRRVLQDDGVLRISVPDAERYLRAYCEYGWAGLAQIRPLGPGRTDHYFNCQYHTKMELINVVFRQGFQHKYAYDYETLEFVLRTYGFSKINRQESGTSLMKDLCVDNEVRASESLYVEARK